jgi:hypothetical protein
MTDWTAVTVLRLHQKDWSRAVFHSGHRFLAGKYVALSNIPPDVVFFVYLSP